MKLYTSLQNLSKHYTKLLQTLEHFTHMHNTLQTTKQLYTTLHKLNTNSAQLYTTLQHNFHNFYKKKLSRLDKTLQTTQHMARLYNTFHTTVQISTILKTKQNTTHVHKYICKNLQQFTKQHYTNLYKRIHNHTHIQKIHESVPDKTSRKLHNFTHVFKVLQCSTQL